MSETHSHIAPISEFMTAAPFTIGRDQSLAEAKARMREHLVRHLPVLSGGKVVGVLSERDVALVESLPGVNPVVVRVDEAMSDQPYHVDHDTSLAEVTGHMATHRLGTALVMKEDKVVGIFTTVDALRLLSGK